MYSEHFAKKLQKARKDAGYTQEQIQDITGIERTSLSKYENGAVEPNLETVAILADFYEVSVDWLLGTKGNNK